MDIAVFRRDQQVLRTFLRDWEVWKASPGRPGRLEPWPEGESLKPPVHEIHARREAGEPRDLEFLLEEAEGDRWVYRRDANIVRPLGAIGRRSRSGIPSLAPEIVLLYKARNPTDRDGADFRALAGRLDPDARGWLSDALAMSHPRSPWRPKL